MLHGRALEAAISRGARAHWHNTHMEAAAALAGTLGGCPIVATLIGMLLLAWAPVLHPDSQWAGLSPIDIMQASTVSCRSVKAAHG